MKAVSLSLSNPFGAPHGGTLRTKAFIEAFRHAGVETDAVFPNLTGRNDEVNTGTGLGYQLRRFLGPVKRHFLPMPTAMGARRSDVERDLSTAKADVLLISALSQLQYSSLHFGDIWLDFMDIWSEFAKREALHRHGIAKITTLRQAKYLQNSERSGASRARWVTAAGWKDTSTLNEWGIPAKWVPTPIADRLFKPTALSAGADRCAGFIGNFEFWPNRDAYDLIRDRWAPTLERQGWKVVIAGRKSETLSRSGTNNIDIIGEVDDVTDFYRQCSISLAPIRLGGGIKVKVAESLAQGRPVIGTPQAFEGFPPSMHPYLGLVHGPQDVASALGKLRLEPPPDSSMAYFRQAYLDSVVEEELQAHG